MRGIKVIIDGAIAGRTAALKNGYANDADNHGVLLIEDQNELNGIDRIHRAGYQACVHANGDIAIEMALKAIEHAQKGCPRDNARHRIEHCTMIDDQLLAWMARMGVLALPFGSYLWQHGEKLRPFADSGLTECLPMEVSCGPGVRVAGSSDHPAGLYPLLGVQSMVTRRTAAGGDHGAEEKISLMRHSGCTRFTRRMPPAKKIKERLNAGATRGYGRSGAGSLELPPEEISNIDIHQTIVGGRTVHGPRLQRNTSPCRRRRVNEWSKRRTLALLETQNVTKSFGALTAVSEAHLQVEAGKVHSIIGPNKLPARQLFSICSQAFFRRRPGLSFSGIRNISALKLYERANIDIGRSYQRVTSIFPELTVHENVRLAVQSKVLRRVSLFKPAGRLKDIVERADRILEEIGIADYRNQIASTIPYGVQRSLDVGIALATDPKLLLLDEPTSGMSPEDTVKMIGLVERISQNYTIALIEHHMKVVMSISDTITVLSEE
ncbi:MAG: amidohydrolase family protein [Desulfomicrobium escambiense]|nr:amidohydrolase family protein [Desulfomicrobium escambiense]